MQQATSFGRRGVGPAPSARTAPPQAASPQAAPPRPAQPQAAPAPPQAAVYAADPAVPGLSWAEVTGRPAAAPAPFAGGIEFYGAPVVTTLLTLALALLYWVEQAAALSPGVAGAPGYRTLTALGGVSSRLVFQDGQVWRLFTAPWLHASLGHLVGNSVVLVIAGMRLERLVRAPWLLAIYLASAVGGSLFSAILNPGGPVSVGASGAIMGLLGASLVLSFHAAAEGRRGRLRLLAIRLLIPALLPTSGAVDYSCHLGGVLTGAMMGLVLNAAWPRSEPKPPSVREAQWIAGALAALTALSVLLTASQYGAFARREPGLIPDALIPRKTADAAEAADLLSRFPRDPRAYLYQATADLQASPAAGATSAGATGAATGAGATGAATGAGATGAGTDGGGTGGASADGAHVAAEQALRTGLAQTDVLDHDMPPQTRDALAATLAGVLADEGRLDEARTAAAPVCAEGSLRMRAVRAKLVQAKLCG